MWQMFAAVNQRKQNTHKHRLTNKQTNRQTIPAPLANLSFLPPACQLFFVDNISTSKGWGELSS